MKYSEINLIFILFPFYMIGLSHRKFDNLTWIQNLWISVSLFKIISDYLKVARYTTTPRQNTPGCFLCPFEHKQFDWGVRLKTPNVCSSEHWNTQHWQPNNPQASWRAADSTTVTKNIIFFNSEDCITLSEISEIFWRIYILPLPTDNMRLEDKIPH